MTPACALLRSAWYPNEATSSRPHDPAWRWVLLALTFSTAAPSMALAQPVDPEPATDTDTDTDTDTGGADELQAPDGAAELRREVERQRAELEALRAELVQMNEQQGELVEGVGAVLEMQRREQEAAEVRRVAAAEAAERDAVQEQLHAPLRLNAHVTLRYDNFIVGDPADLVGGEDYLGGFRTRVRLGATYAPEGGMVQGGVRLVVGENPNAAASLVPIGDAARTTSVGFDQYYLRLRPLEDRGRLVLTAGKMPNPVFRGWSGVGWRSELVFDTDIMPTGIAATVGLVDTESLRLRSLTSYFVVQDIENTRFRGKAGTVSLFVQQLQLMTEYLDAAATLYRYGNLNSGLSAPGLQPGVGADLDPGTSAYLFATPGLQRTNNRVNYGPNANGFIQENWYVIALMAQGHHDLATASRAGTVRLYGMLDFVHNASADRDQTGVAASAGLHLGGWDEGHMNPFDLWFTYRWVDGDATLSTFADADLGGGTSYRGIEVGASIHLHEQVKLLAAYFDFRRFPRMTERVQRAYFDVIWNY